MAQQDENGDISFNYDPTASEGFTLLNAGNYRGIIEDCPIKRKADDPNAVPFVALKVRVDPMPGRERGRVLFENVSFKAEWKLSQLRDAVYGKSAAGETKINPAELQGAVIFFYVGVTNDTRAGHAGQKQNNIARFIPLEEAESVVLYDWAAELEAANSAPESGASAGNDGDQGWGDLPEGQQQPAAEEGSDIPFDEPEPEPEPAPTRRAAAPAAPSKPATKTAASKKAAPARRR